MLEFIALLTAVIGLVTALVVRRSENNHTVTHIVRVDAQDYGQAEIPPASTVQRTIPTENFPHQKLPFRKRWYYRPLMAIVCLLLAMPFMENPGASESAKAIGGVFALAYFYFLIRSIASGIRYLVMRRRARKQRA